MSSMFTVLVLKVCMIESFSLVFPVGKTIAIAGILLLLAENES